MQMTLSKKRFPTSVLNGYQTSTCSLGHSPFQVSTSILLLKGTGPSSSLLPQDNHPFHIRTSLFPSPACEPSEGRANF